MSMFEPLLEALRAAVPTLLVLATGLSTLRLVHYLLLERGGSPLSADRRVYRQLLVFALALTWVVGLLLTLPIGDAARGQLLGLFGLLLSAVVALSSTTFVGNAMAGFMLRVINSFRPGDFIRIGEHFGRVVEMGLLHTEIQTEDRDSMALPNLFVVTHPVKVVHADGTLVSAEVTLGYDVPHTRVERLLSRAAKNAGLGDPFVLVLELGDFSIRYRVAGFLPQVKQLVSQRSLLHSSMLDALHDGGVEIVSPNFMNQRPLDPDQPVMPPMDPSWRGPKEAQPSTPPEARMFDRADEAQSLERRRMRLDDIDARLAELQQELQETTHPPERARIARVVERLELRRKAIVEGLAEGEG